MPQKSSPYYSYTIFKLFWNLSCYLFKNQLSQSDFWTNCSVWFVYWISWFFEKNWLKRMIHSLIWFSSSTHWLSALFDTQSYSSIMLQKCVCHFWSYCIYRTYAEIEKTLIMCVIEKYNFIMTDIFRWTLLLTVLWTLTQNLQSSNLIQHLIEIHLALAVPSFQLACRVGVLSTQIHVLFIVNKSVLCKRN